MKEKPMINKEGLLQCLDSCHSWVIENYSSRYMIDNLVNYANEHLNKIEAFSLLSKTLPEITEDELRYYFERPFNITEKPGSGCIKCIDDIMVEEDHVNFTYETWFDVDDYFITETEETDDWINFYTDWHPDGSIITAMFIIDKADGSMEEHNWKLTIKEQEFFRNLMEAHCQKLYQKSIGELWQEFHMTKNETLGGR